VHQTPCTYIDLVSFLILAYEMPIFQAKLRSSLQQPLTIFSPEFLPTYQNHVESYRLLGPEKNAHDSPIVAKKECLAKMAIHADNDIQKVVCSSSSYIM
jgi:hypothetical protein